MYQKTYTYGLCGLDVYPLTVEVDVQAGLPAFHIVGLPDSAIKESKERVRSTIRNCGFEWKPRRVTVNLSPAHIKKEGPSFDLAIALGILGATQQIPTDALDNFILLGELSLDGKLQPVRGTLPVALSAQNNHWQGIIVPRANAEEAALNKHLPVFAADRLEDTVLILANPQARTPFLDSHVLPEKKKDDFDFSDVKGQYHVKRGLEIAAAGGHNVLLIGPPGSGKSMLAKRFSSILPDLNERETMEVTRIHSIMGLLKKNQGLIRQRPFRSPHHTTSDVAIVGGGSHPKPGEVTLAHHGVLFMDELPEFNRNVIESLRQPLEDGQVTIARAHQTVQFPAKFLLIGAMNPCPCGFFTDRKKPCRCHSFQIQKYLGKISGPLLDRMDIHLDVPSLPTEDLLRKSSGEPSVAIKARTSAAWQRAQVRFKDTNLNTNAQMTHKDIERFCPLNGESLRLLREAIRQLNLSARAYDKIIKIGRTIADLAEGEHIQTEHIAEAIHYRSLDRDYWRV